jgi:hypothetical protein
MIVLHFPNAVVVIISTIKVASHPREQAAALHYRLGPIHRIHQTAGVVPDAPDWEVASR